MAPFPVDEAQIVALFMEAVTYGIYLVTLGMCLRALFWSNTGKKKHYNWPLIVVALLMFVFATFDVAFGLRHNLNAFIYYKGPGGPIEEFRDISYWVNVMKTVDVQFMTLIGDGMLIYRCLVVFSYKWLIIVFPSILWLGNAVCSAIIIYITSTLRTDALLSVDKLSPFLASFLVITLVTNILTTGLIVWRIWSIDRKTTKLSIMRSTRNGRSRLSDIVRIIIESGLLYTVFVLVTFGTELASSNAIYGVSDMMVVVVGISFNLIIIRVDQGIAVGETVVQTSQTSSVPLRIRPNCSGQTPSGVQVMISQDIDREIVTNTSATKDGGSIRSTEPKNSWEDV